MGLKIISCFIRSTKQTQKQIEAKQRKPQYIYNYQSHPFPFTIFSTSIISGIDSTRLVRTPVVECSARDSYSRSITRTRATSKNGYIPNAQYGNMAHGLKPEAKERKSEKRKNEKTKKLLPICESPIAFSLSSRSNSLLCIRAID